MEHATFGVEGMSCGHCVKQVATALSQVPGVVVEQVTVGEANVSYDPQRTNPAAIADAIDAAGYASKTKAAAAATRLATLKGGCGCGCRH